MISAWSTTTSNTRSRRWRCGSSSTTSTGWRAWGADGPTRRPTRRGPARTGRHGQNLAAFAVYLMVVQFVPAHRVVALLESLTGTAPSVGFVHGLLARTAGLLAGVHDRIRTLITLAYAVCCDETPLKVGSRTPRPGKKKAERYLLVACTDLYTHYLLGDRSLDTFTAFVLAERAAAGRLVVHDQPPRTTTRSSSPGWSTNCVPPTCCVILTMPPRSIPTRSGPRRSPGRCAN